ncbi:MAG TPA: SDR family oxidoreductase [Acidimicrobiales bacterium]|jgi:NAD(P)-dependent dehydrogenase (short-subunit alcohol dehydrogenase family)|nr:SDR family oxidoreductase [Acidimicrobiales bacterium]
MNKDVVVVIGAGGIGQAIARRQGTGRLVLLADYNDQTLKTAADSLEAGGHDVTTRGVDVSRLDSVRSLAEEAAGLGPVAQVIHTAGLSPVQASPQAILAVDLYGVAVVLEEFGRIVAAGGAGLVISSMAGHMLPALPPEHDRALASTPADDLLQLPMLSPEAVPNSGVAYAMAKRANKLRVQAAAVTWGDRGARINVMSPGIILTPLARDEMSGPGAATYRQMVEQSSAGRVGTTDEIATAAAFLLGPDAGFITGSDLLIDGGVIAAIRVGRVQLSL